MRLVPRETRPPTTPGPVSTKSRLKAALAPLPNQAAANGEWFSDSAARKRTSGWSSPAAIAAVAYDGLLWISYPKRSSKVETDLSRDVLWDLMMETGLRPVTQVSIDDVWSALRFRPAEKVGK